MKLLSNILESWIDSWNIFLLWFITSQSLPWSFRPWLPRSRFDSDSSSPSASKRPWRVNAMVWKGSCWFGFFKHEFRVTLEQKNMRHPTKKQARRTQPTLTQPCFDGNVPSFPNGRRPCTLQSFGSNWGCQLRRWSIQTSSGSSADFWCQSLEVPKWEDFSQQKQQKKGVMFG